MARPLRINFEGAWYHVMSRGANRNTIFFNDIHRHEFLNQLKKTKEIYGIEIHAYCLMSNHYHLIIHTPRGNISEAMKYINAGYAQLVNLTTKRDGPLFRGRFKAIIISADEYLLRLSRYIHLNPLAAKIVTDLHSYKWSSYLDYIGKTKPAKWLSKSEIINRFGSHSFKKNYRKFVELESDTELNNFYQTNKLKPILGDVDFCRMINEHLKNSRLSAEISGSKSILIRPAIQEVIDLVTEYFEVDTQSISKIDKKSGNIARQITSYICRKLGGYSLREIAGAIGNIKYKGVSKAIARVSRNNTQLNIAKKLMAELKRK